MANINLLPWREERREELKREFFVVLGGMAVAAALVLLVWHTMISASIDTQNARNSFLDARIKELDAQVKEIDQLKQKRAELLDRMKIIQELQGNRPEIVHIFDELARTAPDGVFYTAVDRQGKKLSIKGTAESNNRVSSLMRRLDASEWFANPNLISVKANPSVGEQANDFELTLTLETPAIIAGESGSAEKKGK